MEDILKIKEDAIRIQEHDIEDSLRDITNENQKASFILAFIAVFFGTLFDSLSSFSVREKFVFISFISLAAVLALWNIVAKKLETHSKVDSIFVNNEPKEWGQYLNHKHLHLRKIYEEAQRSLGEKSLLNKCAIFIATLSILILIRSIVL